MRAEGWSHHRSRSVVDLLFHYGAESRIVETLDLPMGIPRAILTGIVGTGKTTELFRIAEERKNKEFVVFLQLDRHFQETLGDGATIETVSPWEVCFLAGLAILRAAESLNFRFPEIHRRELSEAWQAAAKASGVERVPEVDIAKLAKQIAILASGAVGGGFGAGLSVLSAVAEAGNWFLQSVNVLIGLVPKDVRPILLILDGLDYIKDVD